MTEDTDTNSTAPEQQPKPRMPRPAIGSIAAAAGLLGSAIGGSFGPLSNVSQTAIHDAHYGD
ncbi:hypothetical protein OPAG_08292 [Rhodococcus opacus PD630]|uniref:hypothetical protein n=1 Tax=Rhodococcus opacus TaxID=37919 RepID=UPI00029CAD40|nr:hypothetical protein [Rhodococcus opacus]AHK35657.1 hypothetical protein Pd630_LPD11082 [Rhodococcus opacus PD630]EHI43754.1 hypothetical protein OPAG_08292 [Rhodococcus opacus PD630]UDH01147.1 hypothetical protein K2Z90_007591 [Rhodococcus opacus PD630]